MGAQLETWQIWVAVGSPIIALLGTIAALSIAVVGTKERAKERRTQQESEARMFLVRGTGLWMQEKANTFTGEFTGEGKFFGMSSTMAHIPCWMWSMRRGQVAPNAQTGQPGASIGTRHGH